MAEDYCYTTLLLIRHGQARASDGSYDLSTPLSEHGQRQAALIADALLAGTPPAAVYASPAPRARQTAAPLCRQLNSDPRIDQRLLEFDLGHGSLETAVQRPDLLIWRPEQRGVEHGETLGEFAARVAACCEEIVERHPGQLIALFMHSGTIDAALRWALGMSPQSFWQNEFNLPNASITEIEFWPRGRTSGGAPRYAVIRRIGDASHLGDLHSDI